LELSVYDTGEMYLLRRVPVFFEQPVGGDGRITLSNGTRPAGGHTQNGRGYAAGAVIPAEPWREPSPAERDLLLTDSLPTGPANWIAVISVPDAAVTGLRHFPPQSNLPASCIEALLLSLSPYIVSRSSIRVHCITTNPPGLLTGTIAEPDGVYLGLHLDSWDRLSFPENSRARNRVCINLGTTDRSFLFLNLTLADMLAATGSSVDAIRRAGASDVGRAIGRLFLERFPDYPVVKLRVRPDEAYVAPTENLLHDASTADMTSEDVQLTLRGHFRIPGQDARRGGSVC